MNTKGMKELKPKLDREIIIAVVVIALSFIGAWQVIFGFLPWVGEFIDENVVTEQEMYTEFKRQHCYEMFGGWRRTGEDVGFCYSTTTGALLVTYY